MKSAELSRQAALTRTVRELRGTTLLTHRDDTLIRGLSKTRVPRKILHPMYGRLLKQSLTCKRRELVFKHEREQLVKRIDDILQDRLLVGSIFAHITDEDVDLFWFAARSPASSTR